MQYQKAHHPRYLSHCPGWSRRSGSCSSRKQITDTCHTVRDGHGGQFLAGIESTPPDTCHTVRDGHGGQARAVIESIATRYLSHCPGWSRRSGSCSPHESPSPDACHTVRDGHGGQARAACESILPDTCHTVRDGHGGQYTSVHYRRDMQPVFSFQTIHHPILVTLSGMVTEVRLVQSKKE